ncbi:hypothetical protein OIU84_027305, partial [Salix udensis]
MDWRRSLGLMNLDIAAFPAINSSINSVLETRNCSSTRSLS